jgi:hypothetical protein
MHDHPERKIKEEKSAKANSTSSFSRPINHDHCAELEEVAVKFIILHSFFPYYFFLLQ